MFYAGGVPIRSSLKQNREEEEGRGNMVQRNLLIPRQFETKRPDSKYFSTTLNGFECLFPTHPSKKYFLRRNMSAFSTFLYLTLLYTVFP